MYRSHLYMDDGILFPSNYVVDENLSLKRVKDVTAQWMRSSGFKSRITTHIQSFDEGYSLSQIESAYMGPRTLGIYVTTLNNRRALLNPKNYVLTTSGYRRVDSIGIGAKLITMDLHKASWNDTLPISATNQNHYMRAFLKNHRIEFTVTDNFLTMVDGIKISVVDWDMTAPVQESDVLTLGKNQWREFIKDRFGVGEYSTDIITKLRLRKSICYMGSIHITGGDTIVLQNGLVIKSSQIGVKDDGGKRYESIDPSTARSINDGNEIYGGASGYTEQAA